MFNKKDKSNHKGFDTLIGPGTVVEGNLETEGMVRVEGRIKGDLKVNGDVYIGSKAVINGSIFANDAYISGTVEGNINSSSMLRLLPTAKLYGDIDVHTFVADEGSLFQGRCNMIRDDGQAGTSTDSRSSKRSSGSRGYRKSSIVSDAGEESEKGAELKEA